MFRAIMSSSWPRRQQPGADLAVREPEPEGTWLLEGTAVGELLHHTTTFENSILAGYNLRPATRAELRRTFVELKTRLQPGDTLLVFVTDHGTANPRDALDNRISLWGAHESLSVRDLRALLARLPAQVRVVTLMSQCFSGGFAYLYDLRARGQLRQARLAATFHPPPTVLPMAAIRGARGRSRGARLRVLASLLPGRSLFRRPCQRCAFRSKP